MCGYHYTQTNINNVNKTRSRAILQTTVISLRKIDWLLFNVKWVLIHKYPLCCLFFCDIRILIIPLVSSNSSIPRTRLQKTNYFSMNLYGSMVWFARWYIEMVDMVRKVLLATGHQRYLLTNCWTLWSCEFEPRSRWGVVDATLFVSDLRQVGGFPRVLRFLHQ